MKQTPLKKHMPDKNLHIPKRFAGGATRLALGAMVGGPVKAIIGEMAGAMVWDAAERHSSTVARPALMKESAKMTDHATRANRGKAKMVKGRSKSPVLKKRNKDPRRSARRGSKTSRKEV